MNARDQSLLEDMVRYATDAIDLLGSRDAAALETDMRSQYAVILAVEVIGEAASRVSAETRAALPAVPWKQVIGMRSILIHRYYELDLGTVVQTVQEHLAQLIAAIRQFLGDDPK